MLEKKEGREKDIDKLISIILPTYNSEQTIDKAIQSIYKQDVKNNLEIIIVDDNSTDMTIKAIKNYKNTNRVKLELIQNEINMGSGFSRKIGLEKAKGYFIAFLDSDDYWLKDKLKSQLSFFKQNCQVDFVYSDYLKELKNNNKIYHFHMKMPESVSLEKNKFINFIPNSSVLIKSLILKKITYPSIRIRNDFIYWNRILSKNKNIKAYNCLYKKPLFVYSHIHGISRKGLNLLKVQWIMYRKYFKYSLLKSTLGLLVNICNSIINKVKEIFFLFTKKLTK